MATAKLASAAVSPMSRVLRMTLHPWAMNAANEVSAVMLFHWR